MMHATVRLFAHLLVGGAMLLSTNAWALVPAIGSVALRQHGGS